MKTALNAMILLAAASAGNAHEVWIERDCDGPARIYLGEPADMLPPGGDPEFDKLKSPKLVPETDAVPVRKAGYIEVAVPPGDVRVVDDNVFAPWSEGGKTAGAIYFARAGNIDAKAAMPFEIVPVASNGSAFTLQRDGVPVKGITMTVVSPDRWSKRIAPDQNGVVTVPVREPGRYLISATQKENARTRLAGGEVSIVHRTATTSFFASGPDSGLKSPALAQSCR